MTNAHVQPCRRLNARIVWVHENTFCTVVNLTYIQIINHIHILLNSVHTAKECQTKCRASHAQHCCLSPWLISPPHSEPCVLRVCICLSALALTFWRWIIEFLYRCTPAGSPWHRLWIDVRRASQNVNRNYLPSSNGGESARCVIPISPLDIKNAPRIQRGNIMSVSWIRLARQNLRRSYGRPWVSLLFFPSLFAILTPPSLLLSVHLDLPHSVSLFSAALSDKNCSSCVCASKKKVFSGLKFNIYVIGSYGCRGAGWLTRRLSGCIFTISFFGYCFDKFLR